MFELKPITKEGIPKAIAKAEHYRFLNEPGHAESICRDVLNVDPGNQKAQVELLLALTDQFGKGFGVGIDSAQHVLSELQGEYERAYYAGIIFERWGKAQLGEGVPGYVVYDRFRQAMTHYEQAVKMSPVGNDDAILRWNTCVRILQRNESIKPRLEDQALSTDFSDDVPLP